MRILVVEDEREVAIGLERGLRKEGFEVDVAHDGNDGLWLARERQYDAMILDIMLPGRNGYQVCRTLRDEGNWVPILMLTAKEGEYDEAEGLDTGADDYLRKPFSFVVLVARLKAMVRRRAGSDQPTFAIGDLVLDPLGLRCRRGEAEIELTKREVAVLSLLMQRAGRPVSKREIVEYVWGEDGEVDDNTVEVYIRRLRTKIDEPFGARSIQTVRGVGYQLEPS
jgi:two-component system OmpR family response regulator